MSSIWQTVLQQNLNRIKDSLPEKDRDNDSYAFLIFSMMSILDIDIEEAISSSTEGSGDGGIDGIYIDQTRDDEIEIHIFQAKHFKKITKGLSKNEIDLTIAKVEEILKGQMLHNQSPKIKAKI